MLLIIHFRIATHLADDGGRKLCSVIKPSVGTRLGLRLVRPADTRVEEIPLSIREASAFFQPLLAVHGDADPEKLASA